MNKRRILIFSTAYFPFIGGAEIAVKEITDRLPEYDWTLVTARMDVALPAHERLGNIEVYRIGNGNSADKFRLAISGASFAEHIGAFDCVWSIMASYAGFAGSSYKKKHPTVPFLLTLQEGDSRARIYSRVFWCWPLFKRIFTCADRIQAISQYLKQWAIRLSPRATVNVIPNGVHAPLFAGTVEERANARKEVRGRFGIPLAEPLVVTISRLVSKNGVGDLISAMSFLSKDTHLLIVGGGKLETRLKQKAQRANVRGRVHFAGTIDPADIPRYLWSSDVFCRPSISEGLGNAFLEAMAAGIPVVGTLVGGIPDFLSDHDTGLACAPRDPRDIAEKIEMILRDAPLSDRLRARARALVEEKYGWDRVAREMDDIFRTV